MTGAKNNVYVIIVAGGSGKRFGGDLPKQFLPVGEKPVIIHTIEAFYNALPEAKVLVAINEEWKNYWLDLVNKYFHALKPETVSGGKERFFSVKNALDKIPDVRNGDIVLVHDAVRPVVSVTLINRVIEGSVHNGSAVPYVPVEQTLRKIVGDNMDTEIVDRNKYIQIQTPQGFSLPLLKEAYKQAFDSNFTDDASVFEAAGYRLHFVTGDRMNIKITYPDDIVTVRKMLSDNC